MSDIYGDLLAQLKTANADTIDNIFVTAAKTPGVDLERFKRMVRTDILVRLAAIEASK